MSARAYTEDQLIEQPAIGLFAELGWSTVSALEGNLRRDRDGQNDEDMIQHYESKLKGR